MGISESAALPQPRKPLIEPAGVERLLSLADAIEEHGMIGAVRQGIIPPGMIDHGEPADLIAEALRGVARHLTLPMQGCA